MSPAALILSWFIGVPLLVFALIYAYTGEIADYGQVQQTQVCPK